MKFFILVIFLFLFSVNTQNQEVEIPIDGSPDTRYNSQALIHLAGSIGCAAGCIRKPLNIPQLAACVAAVQLGEKMNSWFTCGSQFNENDCQKTQESTVAGSAYCKWLEFPSSFRYLPNGLCVLQIIFDNKNAFLGGLSAFEPLFQHLSDVDRSASFVASMFCLEQSNKATCQDTRGVECVLCDQIPQQFYPMSPPLTKLCLRRSVFDIACPLFKNPTEDAKRPFCPGKDPNVISPKLPCSAKACPAQMETKCPVDVTTPENATQHPTKIPNTSTRNMKIIISYLIPCILMLCV